MRKSHFIYTEGINRFAPKGKSFVQGSISFEEPLTLEEFDKFNKCMYISNEDLQERIDKAIEHIKTHQLVYQSQYEEMSDFDNHLLDILEGSEE